MYGSVDVAQEIRFDELHEFAPDGGAEPYKGVQVNLPTGELAVPLPKAS